MTCRLGLFGLIVFFAFSLRAVAQTDPPRPVPIGPNLFSLKGTDSASGTEYLRLFLTAEPGAGAAAHAPDPQSSPTFTIECAQSKTKRALSLYVNFGGVEDIAFPPPFKATQGDPFPPRNPSIALTMIFEGYIKSKPFKRSWEVLPNGNERYRNPGIGSANLDDPRFFLQYLNSLPTLHVITPKPEPGKPGELFFHTAALLQETARAPLCQP